MKLENITAGRKRVERSETGKFPPSVTSGEERKLSHPEIAELLDANTGNAILTAPLLAMDEREMAVFIINKLDAEEHYVPSMMVLDAIRSINAKVALGRNLPLR
jgi:hypothetical protein